MPGARSQPAASRAKKTTHEFSHHRYAASTGIPCAMVLRFPSCSSRGPGFLAPVAREFVHELGASVGAPEPHDFAVRDSTARLAAPSASIASRSTFRDDRDTPLLAVRDGTALLLFLPIEKAKYFLKTGWTGQISLRLLAKIAFWRTGQRPSSRVLESRERAVRSWAPRSNLDFRCHSGAMRSIEPGIHNHHRAYGFRACALHAHSGMTRSAFTLLA
jgi:hypothetical protein